MLLIKMLLAVSSSYFSSSSSSFSSFFSFHGGISAVFVCFGQFFHLSTPFFRFLPLNRFWARAWTWNTLSKLLALSPFRMSIIGKMIQNCKYKIKLKNVFKGKIKRFGTCNHNYLWCGIVPFRKFKYNSNNSKINYN